MLSKILKNNYAFLAIFLLGIVYLPCIFYDFIDITDDKVNIWRHHHDYFRILTEPYYRMYIPVTYLIWTSIFKLTSSAIFFHLVNIILHVVNAYLVFRICKSLTFNEIGAYLGALLFALHPFQVEPVVWVTGLKDVLYVFLGLLAINMWLYRRYVPAVVFIVLALLSKPQAVAIVGVMAVAYFFYKMNWLSSSFTIFNKLSCKPVAVATLVTLPIIYLTRSVQTHYLDYSVYEKLIVAVDSIGYYFTRIFLFFDLSVDPARVEVYGFEVSVGIILISYIIWKRSLPGAIFLVSLLPVLGFVHYSRQDSSHVTDRYMYLPMLGPSLWLAFNLRTHKQQVLALVFIVYMAAGAYFRAQKWVNVQTLYRDALFIHSKGDTYYRHKPDSLMVLGIYHRQMGDAEKAQDYFTRALEFRKKQKRF